MTIDAKTLVELRALDEAGGGGLLDELVALFEAGTPERLAKMREGLARADAKAVEREAHALKGSAGALGATALQALASEAEQRAKASDLAPLPEQLIQIEAEFHACLAELKAEQSRK